MEGTFREAYRQRSLRLRLQRHDLLLHLLESGEGVAGVEPLHHVADLLAGRCALGARLERVLLALGLRQLGLQRPKQAPPSALSC